MRNRYLYVTTFFLTRARYPRLISIKAMLFLVSSFLFVSLTSAHPQCLDYLPPFSPSTKLAYCSEYSDFTCCSSPQDENIASQASHTNISEAIVASDDPDLCMEYWKNVSCLSCSPYAAHLFDAEGYDTAQRALPGLCPAYCRSLYGACPRVADVIGGRRFVSESEFCEAARLSDVSYCYPDVKEVERANVREFGSFGCLCVQVRDRRKDRWTDGQTERQIDGQTKRQTYGRTDK